ncbi:hypothetical protein UlMin_027271 [Ulmus minor]
MPHPTLYEEMRESQYGMVHRPLLPPHPAIFEERLAAQHQDIQAFLVDNQRLAVTHVALKKDLEVSQHKLQRMAHLADSVRAKKDVQMRDLYEKFVSLELDLHGVEATGVELQQVNGNIKEHNATRAAIEYEKKGYAENYEHGQMMEKKLILMARELEKLHAEMANTDNRAWNLLLIASYPIQFYDVDFSPPLISIFGRKDGLELLGPSQIVSGELQ